MKSQFNDIHFESMFYKIHGKSDLKKCGGVKGLDGFFDIDTPFPDKTRRYLIYLLDAQSPMVKELANPRYRREEAARAAGFFLTSDNEKDYIEALFRLETDEQRELAFMVLKGQNNRLWTKIAVNEMYFDELTYAMMSPISDARDDKQKLDAVMTKGKIREEMAAILNDLKNDYRLFYGDEEAEMRMKLMAAQKKSRPEDIALRRK